MPKTDDILKQILDEQRRLGVVLERQEKRIEAIEQELKSGPAGRDASGELLPPALLRVLKALAELKTWASADDLSKKVNLSRNLTSGYLTRLREKGYIDRSPNLDPSKPVRYLFKADSGRFPEDVKRLITRQ